MPHLDKGVIEEMCALGAVEAGVLVATLSLVVVIHAHSAGNVGVFGRDRVDAARDQHEQRQEEVVRRLHAVGFTYVLERERESTRRRKGGGKKKDEKRRKRLEYGGSPRGWIK